MDGDFGGDPQEVFAVLAGVVGHAADGALVVEQVVIERRNGAHVNAADGHGPSALERPQRRDHQLAGGREDHGRVDFFGRLVIRSAGPHRAQVERQLLMARVAGNGVDADVPVARHLDGDVRGGAETVHGEASAGLARRKAARCGSR